MVEAEHRPASRQSEPPAPAPVPAAAVAATGAPDAPPAAGRLDRVPSVRRPALLDGLGRALGNRRLQRVVAGWQAPLQRQENQSTAPAEPRESYVYQSARVRERVAAIEQPREDEAANAAPDLAYYEKVIPAVIAAATERGIPLQNALMIMAQAQAEHGKSVPPGNMIFGITTNWKDPDKVVIVKTWEVKDGQRYERTGRFKKFASPEASVEGYLDLLSGKDPEFPGMYKSGEPVKIFQDPNASPEAFLEAMVRGGYSTNPNGYYATVVEKDGRQRQVYVPGYRQQYPKLFARIQSEMKTVLPQLVQKAAADIRRCGEQIAAYIKLIGEIQQELQQSSDDPELERLRQDLTTLHTRFVKLHEELIKLILKQVRIESFQSALLASK